MKQIFECAVVLLERDEERYKEPILVEAKAFFSFCKKTNLCSNWE